MANISNEIICTKSVDQILARPSDILTYNCYIQNNTTETIQSLTFTDTLPEFTTFISNSLFFSGFSIANPSSPNIISFFTNTLIPSGQSSTISFKARISEVTPISTLIKNQFHCNFSLLNTSGVTTIKDLTSNTASTRITNCLLTVTESVDKTICTLDNNLLYTITISNQTPAPAYDCVLINNFPCDLTFIKDTFTINGCIINEISDLSCINLGTLAPFQTLQITFCGKVTSIPSSNKILTFCRVSHGFPPCNCFSQTIRPYVDSTILVTTILNPPTRNSIYPIPGCCDNNCIDTPCNSCDDYNNCNNCSTFDTYDNCDNPLDTHIYNDCDRYIEDTSKCDTCSKNPYAIISPRGIFQ